MVQHTVALSVSLALFWNDCNWNNKSRSWRRWWWQ